jgi:osmoprotectant transport system substrate-binding protein
MVTIARLFRKNTLLVGLAILAVLAVAACAPTPAAAPASPTTGASVSAAPTTAGAATTAPAATTAAPAATTASGGSKGTITVGGKLDGEAQLLTEMYTQLLQKAGYTVNEKLALGNSIIVFEAISSGAIDLYPEFTATGLNKLGVPSAYDPAKDYAAVKDGFEKQYKITWLDAAPLNDGYAICTTKDQSDKLKATKISELAPQVSQLVLASPSDGIAFIDGLKSTYGFDTTSFKSLQKVDYSIGLAAVTSGSANAAVCYTTDGSLAGQNFIFLEDDKNGFPQFHPAPIVRDDVLAKYPDIATILNPLSPKLTTQVSIDLQKQVADAKTAGQSGPEAVKAVATKFLQSAGLLP